MLFNVLLANLEEDMAKGGWDGVKIEEKKYVGICERCDVVGGRRARYEKYTEEIREVFG